MKTYRKKSGMQWSGKIMLGLNLLVILALFISYLAPYINPAKSSIPSLLGLFYPVLFIINLLFALWWIVRLKWIFIFPLMAIIFGWGIFSRHMAFGSKQDIHKKIQGIKVVSYNVRIFNVHNWRIGEKAETRDSILKVLKKINANIVCLQEFFHGEQKYFPTINPTKNALDAPNLHSDMNLNVKSPKHFGLATFTKFPIINRGSIQFSEARSNSGIFTDILVINDTIRVFNIHLESIKFSDSDHQYVADFMEPGTHPNTSSTKVIFSKIRNAFEKRAQQAKTIQEYIEASPYPVILCGDFNDTPSSFAYNEVKGKLSDAFLESGFGFGTTYAGKIPFLRIDYILHSDKIKVFDFQRYKVEFSDHYPISAYFEFE